MLRVLEVSEYRYNDDSAGVRPGGAGGYSGQGGGELSGTGTGLLLPLVRGLHRQPHLPTLLQVDRLPLHHGQCAGAGKPVLRRPLGL